jgi:hypothetical protein
MTIIRPLRLFTRLSNMIIYKIQIFNTPAFDVLAAKAGNQKSFDFRPGFLLEALFEMYQHLGPFDDPVHSIPTGMRLPLMCCLVAHKL